MVSDSEDDNTSPAKKALRTENAGDAPSLLSSARTRQERASPALENRKGRTPRDEGDPFRTTTPTTPTRSLSMSAVRGPTHVSSRRQLIINSNDTSPTGTQRRLYTGRDGTDVEELEQDEVSQQVQSGSQNEDVVMGDDDGKLPTPPTKGKANADKPPTKPPALFQGRTFQFAAPPKPAATLAHTGNPQTETNQQPAPPAPPPAPLVVGAQHVPPVPPIFGGGGNSAQPPTTTAPLSRAWLEATTPTNQHLNPHRNSPAQPPRMLSGPADLTAVAKHQPNEGHFLRAVAGFHKYVENAMPGIKAKITANPDKFVFFPVFNGGKTAFEVMMPVLLKTIPAALSDYAPPGSMQVFSLGQENKDYGKGTVPNTTYSPPYALAAEVTPSVKAAILAVATVAVDQDVSFHIVDADPALGPWVVGFWAAEVVEERESLPIMGTAVRGGLGEEIQSNAGIRQAVDRAWPQSDHRPLDDRIAEMVKTIDTRWDKKMKAWVAYMQPCTTNALAWESVTVLIRVLELEAPDVYVTFKALLDNKTTLGPRCGHCKAECHFAWACPFEKDGDFDWWGSKGQINKLTDGLLARKGRGRGGSRGVQSGPPRGRGHGRGGRGRGSNM